MLPDGTSLIAVHAVAIVGGKKLLAEDKDGRFTTGLVTWKYCPAGPLIPSDWMQPTFDDSNWPSATIANAGDDKIEEVKPSTRWIWAADNSMDVYFRVHAKIWA